MAGRGRRLAWPWLGLCLGGAILWGWTAQAPGRVDKLDTQRGGAAFVGADPTGKRAYVAKLAANGTQTATSRLIAEYGAWVDQPAALDARRDILDAFARIEAFRARVDALAAAVAADPTEPEADPLWSRAVEAMAHAWIEHQDQLAQGRDWMLLEQRPRARRLLATSLARAARSELVHHLAEDERHLVASDLIDIYFEPGSEAFREELPSGIAALSGDDVGTLLSVGVENVRRNDLGVLVERAAAIERARRKLTESGGTAVLDDFED